MKDKQIRLRLCDEARDALTELTKNGEKANEIMNILLIAQAAKENNNNELLKTKKPIQ